MPLKAAYQWLTWLAQRRGHAFLALIILLIVSAGFLGLSLAQSRQAGGDRRDAYEALVSLELMLGTLRDAETGQRGYLLTNKLEYLEPYTSAVGQFADRMATVQRYQPFPPEEVEAIERYARDKLAELQTTIDLNRTGQRDQALSIVHSDRGKLLMDRVRRSVQTLQDHERVRVRNSEERLLASTRLTFNVFLIATGLTAALIIGLVAAYAREERSRRLAETRVARTAARYAAINKAAPGAIITVDEDGRIDEWNPAAEHTFGWTADEILGRTLILLIPERLRDQFGASFVRAMAMGQTSDRDQVRQLAGLRRDGAEFPAEVFIDVFEIEGRRHAIGIVRDITPRKHAEAAQAALQDELQRSNLELQRFAYVASHDLQEPLRMIGHYVGLLAERYEGQLDAQADQYVGFARDAARRMRQLIDDLLRYSRITTKAQPFEQVDVAAVLHEVTNDLRDLIESSGGQLVVASGLPMITGEAFQIRQLLQNLIANGFKFHRPGVPPAVTVACVAEPGQWHFVVADNGIGIEANQIGKLFQLFTRLHPREDYEGTGIGLAICKKIVERHGGQIWIESTPGEGSAFHFTIPRD